MVQRPGINTEKSTMRSMASLADPWAVQDLGQDLGPDAVCQSLNGLVSGLVSGPVVSGVRACSGSPAWCGHAPSLVILNGCGALLCCCAAMS